MILFIILGSFTRKRRDYNHVHRLHEYALVFLRNISYFPQGLSRKEGVLHAILSAMFTVAQLSLLFSFVYYCQRWSGQLIFSCQIFFPSAVIPISFIIATEWNHRTMRWERTTSHFFNNGRTDYSEASLQLDMKLRQRQIYREYYRAINTRLGCFCQSFSADLGHRMRERRIAE